MGDRNLKPKSHDKSKEAVKPAPGSPSASEIQRHEDRRDETHGKIQGKTHGRIRDDKDLMKDMRKSHKPGDR